MAKAQGSLQKSLLGIVVLLLAYGAKSFGCLPLDDSTAREVAQAPSGTEAPSHPSPGSIPPLVEPTSGQNKPSSGSSSKSKTSDDSKLSAGVKRLEQAFQYGESDVIVEAEGTVDRLLADDLEGSRHQKFIVRLATGRTLLISHNIDLAPRVPVDRGDEIEFKGEYEWTDRGGVLHWTHHDPKGWHDDGWIKVDGKIYK